MDKSDLLQIINEALRAGKTYLDLSGKGLKQLPPEIGQLTGLQVLYLRNNQLTAVPAEIGQLIGLQELSLAGNQLTAVPAEIGQLTGLQKLYLDHNQLTALPAEIGQLISLQVLYLFNNQLTAVPAEIGQLTGLQVLSLDHNQLTALPAEIGQLTGLQKLSLAGNPLSTPPPEIIAQGTKTILDFLSALLVIEKIPGLKKAAVDQATRLTRLLADELGPSAERIAVVWNTSRDPRGKLLIDLSLRDSTGEVSEHFAPDELTNVAQVKERLHRLWGELLRQSSRVQLKEVINNMLLSEWINENYKRIFKWAQEKGAENPFNMGSRNWQRCLYDLGHPEGKPHELEYEGGKLKYQ